MQGIGNNLDITERTSVILDEPAAIREVTHEPAAVERTGGCPMWKRLLDVGVILMAMPIWLPVMLLIAIGIQIVSPGRVFFRQERIGYRGRRFTIFKFRSMKMNVDTGVHEKYCNELIDAGRPMIKLDASGDPRIIPLGRLLRASGLDELPQIFNVLLGDMSLVGPRPCTPNEYTRYEPEQRGRFDALPGLTGFWQVHGKNKTTFSEMVAMDIHYARSLSPIMDLSILFMTIPTVIGQLIETGAEHGRKTKKRKLSAHRIAEIQIQQHTQRI
jgi:exopolysaccharide production protein ExoY